TLLDKLMRGEVDIATVVAREGGDFHPIVRVAAFAPHLTEAKKRAAQRAASKTRRVLMLVTLVVLAGVGGGGYVFWRDYQRQAAKREAEVAAEERALAVKREHYKALPQMGLVALVSLGTQDDVKIRGERPRRRRGGEEPSGPSDEEVVSQCKLSQQQIFGTLGKHLAKINVCVQDEKQRDTQGLLPPQLALDFVVKPDGKVVDFQIDDRHYRTGPMNNCMIKAFKTISFPTTTGANCPVTIPIKIGG
ncbi:MAG: hypothetical protein AAB426_01465, partial [Myxococcota bacterium]